MVRTISLGNWCGDSADLHILPRMTPENISDFPTIPILELSVLYARC